MSPSVIPSSQEQERRKKIILNAETITDISSTNYPGHYPGEDHTWSEDEFEANFRTEIHTMCPSETTFSLVGIDASVANALRRIMIAEIPTVAIERCFVGANDSVIQDEVLAHRLGLIPFSGGRRGLRELLAFPEKPTVEIEADKRDAQVAEVWDNNTLVCSLRAHCRPRNPSEYEEGEKRPEVLYKDRHVYAKDIQFHPMGPRQQALFSGKKSIKPVNPDILIAKLQPRECIDIVMHLQKGIGSDHAKFSPVATASYRLMPTIDITKPIVGDDAEKFKKCFSRGVIGVEQVTRKTAKNEPAYAEHVGETRAVVVDPIRDTVSRECLRHPEFQGKVKLGRQRDHFIFSVESTGQWASDELYLESLRLLKLRCSILESQVADHLHDSLY